MRGFTAAFGGSLQLREPVQGLIVGPERPDASDVSKPRLRGIGDPPAQEYLGSIVTDNDP